MALAEAQAISHVNVLIFIPAILNTYFSMYSLLYLDKYPSKMS